MVLLSNEKEVHISTILQRFSHDISKFDLDRILQTLEAMEFCFYVENTGKIILRDELNTKTDII